MSVTATIDIHLPKTEKKHESAIRITQVLVNFGWTLSHNGYIGYLPLGDKDNFDWLEEKISIERLTDILKAKEKANEIIGIIMTWKNTGIGGTFLFWPKGRLHTFSMNIDINRQKIILVDDYEVTDFQWYLPKLLVPLNNVWEVEYFSFDQHI